MGTDCKSAAFQLRWFESTRAHQKASTYTNTLRFLFCNKARLIERVDSNSSGADRRLWRKQGGEAGAAASRMRAAEKQTLGAATRIPYHKRGSRNPPAPTKKTSVENTLVFVLCSFGMCLAGAVPCIRPCASCLKIRRILRKKKKARQSSTDQRAILVGAAGFEPTASSSRTKRATNCAMPRKYRSFSAAVWLGMRESNSHK